eukprot:TRINITY_DN6790_c0_g2_i1.p1 TRINITY_DN6790_c0_g2~~TRINITY_DN6790_c0_g2_i1.p1  ORF type:complete len:356 (+),score=91.46 TRINITY_DN6790_c0_g2_i1:94-1068(+)
MEEVLRGLSQLGPNLEQMAKQIERLDAQVAEHRSLLVQKADAAEMGTLRQQLGSLIQSLTTREKETESQQQQFSTRIAGQVEQLSKGLESKGNAAQLTELEKKVAAVVQELAGKAELVAVRHFEDRLFALSSQLSSKAESSALEPLGAGLKELAGALGHKAEVPDLEKLESQVKELRLSKADAGLVDQMLSQDRTISASLAQKAEFTEVEQLKIQVHALSGAVTQRGESSMQELEAFNSKLQTLTSSVSRCVGSAELRECMKDICGAIEQKADVQKLESLVQSVEMLSDALAPKLRKPARPASARGRRPAPPACAAERDCAHKV